MPDLQAIRDRLEELRANAPIDRDNIAYRDGLLNACEAVSVLLDAPDEAEESIDLAGGAWTIRRTGEHVTIIDAEGKQRFSGSQQMAAVHLAMQLAGRVDYVKQLAEAEAYPMPELRLSAGERAIAKTLGRLQRERDEAQAENERLRQRLLTAAGDDLCRLSQEEIKAYTSGAVKIPPEEEFLASCKQFHAQIAKESGVMENCLTLAQLVAENEAARKQLADARDEYRLLAGSLASATAKLADAIRERDEADKRFLELDAELHRERTVHEADNEWLTNERDEAREAARWLYERIELSGDIADAKQRYPWLAEKGAEHAQ